MDHTATNGFRQSPGQNGLYHPNGTGQQPVQMGHTATNGLMEPRQMSHTATNGLR